VSTKVTVMRPRSRIDGQLTLHGVTKPLTLHAKLNKAAPNPFRIKDRQLGFSATGSLNAAISGVSTYLPIDWRRLDPHQ